MPFAEEFINAFLAGQQARESKFDLQRKRQRAIFEDEDRDIEKEMLQHRLKEMKIQQRLQARQVAQQNLEALTGIPEADVTPDMTEGGVLQARSATGDDSLHTALKAVDIPGVEELGIPGISRRPRTLESQLAEYTTKKRIDALNTPYNLAPGAQRRIGTQVIAQAPAAPRAPVSKVDRDAAGTETQTWITPEEALAGATAVRKRLPPRGNGGGGGSANRLGDEDRNAVIESIIAGRGLSEVPNTTEGLRIKAGLEKRGFNLLKANQDLRAMRAHFQTLNGEGQSRLRVAAEIADSAITELEDAQAAWQSSGRGIFSKAALTAAKSGAMGPEAKQQALDFEAAVSEVQQAVAVLKSGGSQANNKALEQIEAELTTGSNIPATVKRLRNSLQYRIAAIRNLEAITPSSLGAGGGGTADDPLGILGK